MLHNLQLGNSAVDRKPLVMCITADKCSGKPMERSRALVVRDGFMCMLCFNARLRAVSAKTEVLK
jgi:hypothetical protein